MPFLGEWGLCVQKMALTSRSLSACGGAGLPGEIEAYATEPRQRFDSPSPGLARDAADEAGLPGDARTPILYPGRG